MESAAESTDKQGQIVSSVGCACAVVKNRSWVMTNGKVYMAALQASERMQTAAKQFHASLLTNTVRDDNLGHPMVSHQDEPTIRCTTMPNSDYI